MRNSSNSPRVSVLLSSLNHEKYIEEAIASVLSQTFQDFELIIVDDSSEDDSWEIIKSFKDERIRAYRNTERMRASTGFNESILARARGEYIAIHHSDDIFMPDRLQKQVVFLDEHPKFGAVFSHAIAVDELGNPLIDKEHFYFGAFNQPNRDRYQWLNHFFYNGNCLCHPSILIRKRCFDEIGLYDRRLGQLTDFDLWVRLCLKHEIYLIQEPLVRFRVRDSELNQSGNRPETHVRSQLEYGQIFRHYLSIEDKEALLRILPEAAVHALPDENNIPFLVAMCAVASGLVSRQVFGIGVLYDLMRDPVTAKVLETMYGFKYTHLIQITGSCDFYSFKVILKLQEENKRLKKETEWIKKPYRIIRNLMPAYLRKRSSN